MRLGESGAVGETSRNPRVMRPKGLPNLSTDSWAAPPGYLSTVSASWCTEIHGCARTLGEKLGEKKEGARVVAEIRHNYLHEM